MTDQDLQERVQGYLAARNVMVLALVDAEGPWAAPVFFAGNCAGSTLYFVSDPGTRHGQAVGAGAKIGAAVTEDHHDWTAIAGVQLEGFCQPVAAADAPEALTIYLGKFPFTAAFLDPAGPMYAAAGAKARFYQLEVNTYWLTDNQAGFGHRERLPVSR